MTLITSNNSLSLITHDNFPAKIAQQTKHYIQQATADNTRRAYQSAIRQFEHWGGLLPANETSITRYLVEQSARLNTRTLALHLTALSHWHRYQQLPDPTQSPTLRKLLRGIKRQHGTPVKKAKALKLEDIYQLVLACSPASASIDAAPIKLKDIRDKALILLAYFGAFRRSEILALTIEDLQFEAEGMLVLLPRSKTDPNGEGIVKALPFANIGNEVLCPILAIQAWVKIAQLSTGPLFRAINRWDQMQPYPLHLDSLNAILKSLAIRANLDVQGLLSSHSLRRGFATSAALAGADLATIKRQGGWRSDAVVQGYIEEGQIFEENAVKVLLAKFFSKKMS